MVGEDNIWGDFAVIVIMVIFAGRFVVTRREI
jgi:hypothetical protein